MSNAHVHAHLRAILDNIANTHRYAREELREGAAALDRVNGGTMPKPRFYNPDPKCRELAEASFANRPITTFGESLDRDREIRDLAQTIQDAIEDWFKRRKKK